VVLLSNFGLALDYVLMALAPSLTWLFVGRVISGITSASISTSFAYNRRHHASGTGAPRCSARSARRSGGRIYPRAGAWRIAGRHGSAVTVLGRSLPEFRKYAVRLADPARVAAAGSARSVAPGESAIPSVRCICCAPIPYLRDYRWRIFFAQVAHVVLPSTFVLYATLPLRLGCGDGRPDAGDGRYLSRKWPCRAQA